MNTAVLTATEDQILQLHAPLAESLDMLRQHTCTVAREGAILGHHIEGFMEQHHIRTDEEFWTKLRAIDPHLREDVIRFAVRARRAQRKCALLDDPSQLTFALALPEAPNSTNDNPAPVRRTTNEILILEAHIGRTMGFFTEWQDKEPITDWPQAKRESVLESLEPLVKLYRDLGGE